MVSDKQKEQKGSDKIPIPIHRSKWNHGGTKQPPISDLRYVIDTLRANGKRCGGKQNPRAPTFKMFGKIPKKSWFAIIEHAKKCVVDDYKLYSYVANGQQIALIFNAIYELVGVANDAQNYYIPKTLTPNLQNIVEVVKRDAYKNADNNLVPMDEAQLNSVSLAACLKSAAQPDAPVQ
ncbi:hypothetical protein TSUD_344270, partial [Trifolium subterraneum]